jgi:hypothetical protein
MQAGVEVDVRVGPEPLSNLLTREDRAAALGEQLQQPRRLGRQAFCLASLGPSQLSAADLELELTETKSIRQSRPRSG